MLSVEKVSLHVWDRWLLHLCRVVSDLLSFWFWPGLTVFCSSCICHNPVVNIQSPPGSYKNTILQNTVHLFLLVRKQVILDFAEPHFTINSGFNYMRIMGCAFYFPSNPFILPYCIVKIETWSFTQRLEEQIGYTIFFICLESPIFAGFPKMFRTLPWKSKISKVITEQ